MNLADLTPDPNNANTGTFRGRNTVERSLLDCGAGRSIVTDKNGVILAGNKTAQAAEAAGLNKELIVVESDGSQLVVVKRTDLDASDSKAKELALADNRTSELGLEWNPEVLKELSSITDLDFSLYFSPDELKAIVGSEEVASDPDKDDAAPEPPANPVSKQGDIWVLGNHRVMCGDGTDADSVSTLMSGDVADLFITDPPYNVSYVGKTKDALTIDNDSMSDTAFRTFLRDAFAAANQAMRAGASFYIWHADSEGYNFRGACHDIGWQVRQCLIWNKNSLVMGRQDYHWKHEPCLYGWKEGSAHYWGSDRTQTTVLDFSRPSRSTQHPTMKPVDLFQYQITNNSRQGNIVLDTFGGSGTTVIACEKLNRLARVMELDPAYVDVIVERWQTLTGKQAVHINGVSFVGAESVCLSSEETCQ